MCVSLFPQKNKIKFALWRVKSLLPSDLLVAHSDHAGEEPGLFSLLGSRWDPDVTQRKTVFSLWCLGRPSHRTSPSWQWGEGEVAANMSGSWRAYVFHIISFRSYSNSLRASAAIIPVCGWEVWVQRHCLFAQAQATTKFSLGFEADRSHTPKLLWYKMQIKNVCEQNETLFSDKCFKRGLL